MSEADDATTQRDRSPGFPCIALEDALQRLVEFENRFKRSGARPEKTKDAWGIKNAAYAGRIAAALRYFGLLDYQGQGAARAVVVSKAGRKYLSAQQEETKREVIVAAALRPTQIEKYWKDWGDDRPADAACLDRLTIKDGFSAVGARDFLKVYDATIAFAKLFGERELTAGLLSKGASFRLIVSGQIGVKELERLISKLEIDKEILAETDDDGQAAEVLDSWDWPRP